MIEEGSFDDEVKLITCMKGKGTHWAGADQRTVSRGIGTRE